MSTISREVAHVALRWRAEPPRAAVGHAQVGRAAAERAARVGRFDLRHRGARAFGTAPVVTGPRPDGTGAPIR